MYIDMESDNNNKSIERNTLGVRNLKMQQLKDAGDKIEMDVKIKTTKRKKQRKKKQAQDNRIKCH